MSDFSLTGGRQGSGDKAGVLKYQDLVDSDKTEDVNIQRAGISKRILSPVPLFLSTLIILEQEEM